MSAEFVCGEQISYFCEWISDTSGGQVRYPYQKQSMCSPQTNWTWVCCWCYYIQNSLCYFDGCFVGLHLELYCTRQ